MALPENIANSSIPGEVVPIATLAREVLIGDTAIEVTVKPTPSLESAGQFRIIIGQEIMLVTGGQATTQWTVSREQEGSVAAAHPKGMLVYHFLTVGGLDGRYPAKNSLGQIAESALPSPVQSGGLYQRISVTKFGLKESSTGAQTAAILQEAMNECAFDGLELVLAPWTMTPGVGLIIPTNLHMTGFGSASVLKGEYEAGTQAVIRNEWATGAVENVHLTNFAIDRRGKDAQHGLLLRRGTHLTLDRLYMLGSNHTEVVSGAINIGGFQAAATTDTCFDVHVSKIYLLQPDNFGIQLGSVTGASIKNIYCQEGYREVIGVEPGKSLVARGISIEGVYAEIGNNIHNVSSSATGAIVLTESSEGTLFDVTGLNITVYNPTPVENNQNPGLTVLLATASEGKGVSLGNMICEGTNGPGYNLGSSSFPTSGVTIMGGAVRNCGEGKTASYEQSGISLRHAVDCAIRGVYVKGIHHTASVYETEEARGNTVEGCYLLDTVPYVPLEGSASRFRNNALHLTTLEPHYYEVLSSQNQVSPLKPTAAKFETFPRSAGNSATSQSALSTERLSMVAIWLPAGTPIGHLSFVSGSTPASEPKNWWFALFNEAREMLAITADQTTAAWAGSTLKELAISETAKGLETTFTTTYSGIYYMGVVMKATVVPTLEGVSPGGTAIGGLAPIICGTSSTGLSVPKTFPYTAGTINFANAMLYAYVG